MSSQCHNFHPLQTDRLFVTRTFSPLSSLTIFDSCTATHVSCLKNIFVFKGLWHHQHVEILEFSRSAQKILVRSNEDKINQKQKPRTIWSESKQWLQSHYQDEDPLEPRSEVGKWNHCQIAVWWEKTEILASILWHESISVFILGKKEWTIANRGK